MGISHFFIDRPIFAAVLSIIITLVGAIAFVSLPVAQYPDVVPPTFLGTGSYPASSAEVVVGSDWQAEAETAMRMTEARMGARRRGEEFTR